MSEHERDNLYKNEQENIKQKLAEIAPEWEFKNSH